MISVEEAKRLGIAAQFSEPYSGFVISTMSTIEAGENVKADMKLGDLIERNVELSDYSKELDCLFFNFLVFPTGYKGVKREERKYHKRSEKKFFMDIKIADYEGFCKADEREALAILARETLRGAAKFLSKEKHFDHEKFLRDLEGVFRLEGIL